jgi:hypothetical protein
MTPIEYQLKEVYSKIVWSHKIQEKAAEVNAGNHKHLKLILISVSALTAGTLIVSVFGKSETGTIISAFLASLNVGLQAYTKDLDYSQKSNQHAKTANSLRAIREDYLSLLTDMKSVEMPYDKIVERRDQLKLRLDEIYDAAPKTGNLAYQRADKALNVRNDHTFSGHELDRFLPESLHDKGGKPASE